MFDLIDECGKDINGGNFKKQTLFDGLLQHSTLKIENKKQSEEFSLDEGEYHIFNLPSLYDEEFYAGRVLQKELVKVIKRLLKHEGYQKGDGVLIVGLGNSDVEADRLGKEVFDRIDINPLKNKDRVYKFCPNIFFLTGINAIDLTKMLVERFEIGVVILVDSLTTASISRLGTSFQVTSAGLTPGSGVHRFGKKISKQSICARTISIGVPFMINSSSFSGIEDEMLLCPKDISSNIALAGEVIAGAINEVLK